VQFTKKLRARIQNAEVTTSVRIWKQPRVRVGGRYALPPGKIEVRSIEAIRILRAETGLGSKDAKEEVESCSSENHDSSRASTSPSS
jgi:hypothetical protein